MSMNGQVEFSAKVQLKHDTTLADLMNLINGKNIPANARMSVYHYAGDQRDPSYTTLTFTWRE